MYKIGISGEPGAGKTTISELILNGENKRVIHLDRVFDSIKKRLNRTNTIEKTNGETGISLSKESKTYQILHSKSIGKMSYSIADLYGSLWLINQIKKAEEEGIEFLIIEGCYLESFIDLQCLDYNVYIDAKKSIREDRVIKRENTLEGIKAMKEVPNEGYDLIVINNATSPYEIIEHLDEILMDNYVRNNTSDKPLIRSLNPNNRKNLH